MFSATTERLRTEVERAEKEIVDMRGEIGLYHEWIDRNEKDIEELRNYILDLKEILGE